MRMLEKDCRVLISIVLSSKWCRRWFEANDDADSACSSLLSALLSRYQVILKGWSPCVLVHIVWTRMPSWMSSPKLNGVIRGGTRHVIENVENDFWVHNDAFEFICVSASWSTWNVNLNRFYAYYCLTRGFVIKHVYIYIFGRWNPHISAQSYNHIGWYSAALLCVFVKRSYEQKNDDVNNAFKTVR